MGRRRRIYANGGNARIVAYDIGAWFESTPSPSNTSELQIVLSKLILKAVFCPEENGNSSRVSHCLIVISIESAIDVLSKLDGSIGVATRLV